MQAVVALLVVLCCTLVWAANVPAPRVQGPGDVTSFRSVRALGTHHPTENTNGNFFIQVSKESGVVGEPVEVTYNAEDTDHSWIGFFLASARSTLLFSEIPEVNGTIVFKTNGLAPGEYLVSLVHYGYVQAVVSYRVVEDSSSLKKRSTTTTTITTTANTITTTTTSTSTSSSSSSSSSTSTSTSTSSTSATSSTSRTSTSATSTTATSATSTSGTTASGATSSTSTSGCPAGKRAAEPDAWLREHNYKRSTEEADMWLKEHNKRRNGIVPPLTWSNKLAASAQAWAENMAATCTLQASGLYGVGENTAYGYDTIPDVMAAWADQEKANYNPETGTCTGVCGHYTQVMWKRTTSVGCGVAHCKGQAFHVCHYVRPGNCNGFNFQSDDSPCEHYFV